MSRLIFLLLIAALSQPAPAKGRARAAHRTHKVKRTSSARTAFRHNNPCPGYVIDHKQALKRGGSDIPENMQWQTSQAVRAKDRVE